MSHYRLLFCCLVLFLHSGVNAEARYVTDEFEVTMRSGTSTANSIVRMLRSGETVTLLEEDLASRYSLVETSDNKKGYVLTRFLMESPAARQTLSKLQQEHQTQLAQSQQQRIEIAELKDALAQAQNDNETLKSTLRSSEGELAEIRDAAADTLGIRNQNAELESAITRLENEKQSLQQENSALKDTTQRDWFIRGAAVSLIAFLIGILITRIRWRKQDSWGSY
ncbi:MAG: TIGR04211 family SH3 domain-containing protein [Pseudomonadota bacterium]